MSITNKIIQKKLDEANEIAVSHVEHLARYILKNNPTKLHDFTMAMGSYFFTDKKKEIIHECMGGNKEMLRKMKGYKELEAFIEHWDNELKITGNPMTFTATGKKITHW